MTSSELPEAAAPNTAGETQRGDASRARVIGYLSAVARRWRLTDGLTRLLWAVTVLAGIAVLGALGRLLGVVTERLALAPLAIAAPLLLLWTLEIVVRRRSRVATANLVDRRLDERDRFKTACELIEGSTARSPRGPIDWTPYVLDQAARRCEEDSASPARVVPRPDRELVRMAAATAAVALISWSALLYFGAPELRLPVELVELPALGGGAADPEIVPPGEGVRSAEAPVPLTEEQLRRLLERAHRDSGLRDDGDMQPFDGELTEGTEGEQGSSEEAASAAEMPDTELLEEVRRDLKEALDAQRGEAPPEGDQPQPGQEGAEGEQAGAAEGEADPDAQQVQDDSMAAGDQQQAQMEQSGQSSEEGAQTMLAQSELAAEAAPAEGGEGEREGQSLGDGTGPQQGEAELYADTPFMPLATTVELQSALIEEQAQDFSTREQEEKELPSRAQKAKRQHRRVTISNRSDDEKFIDTRPVPWPYRDVVQRVFTPEEETEGDDDRD